MLPGRERRAASEEDGRARVPFIKSELDKPLS